MFDIFSFKFIIESLKIFLMEKYYKDTFYTNLNRLYKFLFSF